MPFEKTKESLMNSNDWSLCAENLIDYHKNNGTGRAPLIVLLYGKDLKMMMKVI